MAIEDGIRGALDELLEADVPGNHQLLLQQIVQRMAGEPDWRELRVLVERMPELLGEAIDGMLTRMIANVEAHRACLRECQAEGVDVAFWRRDSVNLSNTDANRVNELLEILDQDESGDLERRIVLLQEVIATVPKGRLWGASQGLLGQTLLLLGEREEHGPRVKEAVAAYRAAVQECTRERAPQEWASMQIDLGAALVQLAEWEGGTMRLEEAVTAYRAALQEHTRDRVPLDWAATQGRLGGVLFRLGERNGGTVRLEEAIAAYRAALQEYTRERAPLEWAATQNNLSVVLFRLGAQEGGTSRLEEAIAACRAALEERTRERTPLEWAATQNNLGVTLVQLGEREESTARLEEAIAAYRAALQEYTRERAPWEWAGTQHNLAGALRALGVRDRGTARLEEAVAAYRAALKERTRERAPLEWAATQNDLGVALYDLGDREANKARLEEAVAAYHAALQERTRECAPLLWAKTQINLGAALSALGELEGTTPRLQEAITAYCAAMEECTRERMPFDWAAAQTNLGKCLRVMAAQRGDPILWREAGEVFEELVSAQLVNALALPRSADQQRTLTGLSELGDEAALAWVEAGDPVRALVAVHRVRAVQANVITWADREATDDAAARELRARRTAWQATNDGADAARRRWEDSARPEDWQHYQMQVTIVGEAFEALRKLVPETTGLDLLAVAAALPEGGALVTLVVGQAGGAAILLRASSSAASPVITTLLLPQLTRTALITLLAGAETEAENGGWIHAYLRFQRQSDDPSWQSWEVWNAAIEGTLKHLSELGIGDLHRWLYEDIKIVPPAEIVIAPPGWLSVLPFAAAADPRSGRCLLDDYAVRLIPNAELLTRCTAAAAIIEQRPQSLLAVTDPREDLLDADERVSPAGPAFEGLTQEVLLGHAATRDRLLQLLPKCSHYVHYGHATWTGRGNVIMVAEDPTYPPGTGNDVISDAEIRRLGLSQLRLTVLAACETGLIDLNHADEFIGLVDSFLQAGCAGVIASLWPVAADATYKLVADTMVRHMRGAGSNHLRSPAQALRAAQLALRDAGLSIAAASRQQIRPRGAPRPQTTIAGASSSQPVFWAAFICAGA
jgi:tetratricopeptide (TPR) repeat protein